MRYDQPFWVGVNNKRFKGVSIDGYLPALEQPEEITIIEPRFRPRPIDKEIDQLKSQVLYLHKKFLERKSTRKVDKQRYTNYKI